MKTPRTVISAAAAAQFLRWFREYVGSETFDEITCPELDALRAALGDFPCGARVYSPRTGTCVAPAGHQGAHEGAQ